MECLVPHKHTLKILFKLKQLLKTRMGVFV